MVECVRGISLWAVIVANHHCSSQLSMPSTTFECTGVSEPPTEIKQSCYKCVSNKAAQIKDENAQEVEKKMRERTGGAQAGAGQATGGSRPATPARAQAPAAARPAAG